MNKDEAKNNRKTWKRQALDLGLSWVELILRDFSDPERAGVPKGEKIGFSLKKVKAAHLMILYPTIRLKDIARLDDTSEGTIRVWRTDSDFKKMERAALETFGEIFFNTIDFYIMRREINTLREKRKADIGLSLLEIGEECFLKVLKSEISEYERLIAKIIRNPNREVHLVIIDDSEEYFRRPRISLRNEESESLHMDLAKLVPFFNPIIQGITMERLAKKLDTGIVGYAGAMLLARKTAVVRNEKGLKQWNEKQEIQSLERTLINSLLDTISDPEAWKRLGEEEIRKAASELKIILTPLLAWDQERQE